MRRHVWMLFTVVAVFACGDEEGGAGSSPAGSGGTGASGTASGAASAAGGSGQGGSAGDASGGSGSATGGSASGGNGSGGSASGGSGGASTCPPDPGDTACIACLKDDCCPELLACTQDPICVCWRDCMKMPSDAAMCFEMCGSPSADTTEYGQCGNDACQSACPQFQ